MLNVTFEMFILHYIMEHVGNLCSPCSVHEQLKIYFLGNISACRIAKNMCDKPVL